jgi:hypothetical protein
MQDKVRIGLMRILVDMVDTIGIEERRTPLDAMNLIAFSEKKLREIRSVLSSDTCNQGFLQTNTLLVHLCFALSFVRFEPV